MRNGQVESLAGAAHLPRGYAGVLRWPDCVNSHSDQKRKCLRDLFYTFSMSTIRTSAGPEDKPPENTQDVKLPGNVQRPDSNATKVCCTCWEATRSHKAKRSSHETPVAQSRQSCCGAAAVQLSENVDVGKGSLPWSARACERSLAGGRAECDLGSEQALLSDRRQIKKPLDARSKPAALRNEGSARRQLAHAHRTPAASRSQLRHGFARCRGDGQSAKLVFPESSRTPWRPL